MLDALKDYYREKRIHRILTFYHEAQPILGAGKIRFISRDAWIHFLLTVLGFLLFSNLTRFMPPTVSLFFSAYAAVELSDFIMIRLTGFFDAIFDYVLPIGFIALIGILFWGQKHYNILGKAQVALSEYHKKKNRELHSRIQKNIANVGSGENWTIEEFSLGKVKPLTLQDARAACGRRNFKIYDGEPFHFIPPLVLNKAAHFWYRGVNGTSGVQLGPGEVTKPSSFITYRTEPMYLTLCVKP